MLGFRQGFALGQGRYSPLIQHQRATGLQMPGQPLLARSQQTTLRGQQGAQASTVASSSVPTLVCDSLEAIIADVKAQAKPGTHVVIMSNGGFGGLHGKLAEALQ